MLIRLVVFVQVCASGDRPTDGQTAPFPLGGGLKNSFKNRLDKHCSSQDITRNWHLEQFMLGCYVM